MPKSWKAAERGIARALGGERVSNRFMGLDVTDVVCGVFSVEVKERKALPAWLLSAMCQSERNAKGGRTPLVALHQLGARYDDALIVMRLHDFRSRVDLHGELKPAEPEVVLAPNEVGE